ncbi:unnamed protein product [Anisakis simplex]|uniref:arginine kinase n=1 Tax=Anisakis simplex TaxID=6269 RepID=A0A0M3K1E8_ANISI|nr:unnamed protein product [Anisakis simplex]
MNSIQPRALRFLQAANACRYWPTGRGIYHNNAKTFLVWVNEEDHLRIISMQNGGNVGQIRGIHGEHSESADGVYDISNKARLGLTEFEAVKQMYDGVKHLIELEKQA